MRLLEYLESCNKTIADAATELGVTAEAVRCWTKLNKIPRPEYMTKIFEWSNGQVQPNDFYEIPLVRGGSSGDVGLGDQNCKDQGQAGHPVARRLVAQLGIFRRSVPA